MSLYQCPACGRSKLDIPNAQVPEADAHTLTMPVRETEVKCRECGWFGPLESLKMGH